jgi:hypothetical protein
MTNNGNGFSGFLDGYTSQNLGSRKESAGFQIEQIKSFSSKLILAFAKEDKHLKSLLEDAAKVEFLVPSLMTFGEIIKSIVIYGKSEIPEILDSKDFSHLILCFIELAKMIADNTVIDIVLEIGESLDLNLNIPPK